MAHASKSFVVFTGGEWSEQLHGRTDLAKADAAGRKVRNFIPAQTGRLMRRKGLEFVGAALGECLAGDPRFVIPTFLGLEPGETIDPSIDEYGTQGPEELRTSEIAGPIWQVCNNIAYCDGPVEEGQEMTGPADRYRTRWVAKLEDGNVFYRRVGTGDGWTQVPSNLIPQPETDMNGLGFCFDSNARPVFASAIGDTIHIWKWSATTPVEFTFYGQGPRLFFNGVLQRDTDYWDVICYFCWNGDITAAFQRDNFQTNYTLFTSEDYYFTRIKFIDHGLDDEDDERLYLAAVGNNNTYGLFETGNYDPWPFYAEDTGLNAAHGIEAVEYDRIIVELGTYEEPTTMAPHGIDSIEYDPLTVEIDGGSEDARNPAHAIEQLEYDLVSVGAGTYQESGENPAHAIEQLEYDLVSVNAGTYEDVGLNAAHAIEEITYE
jgi:hypothetical protein